MDPTTKWLPWWGGAWPIIKWFPRDLGSSLISYKYWEFPHQVCSCVGCSNFWKAASWSHKADALWALSEALLVPPKWREAGAGFLPWERRQKKYISGYHGTPQTRHWSLLLYNLNSKIYNQYSSNRIFYSIAVYHIDFLSTPQCQNELFLAYLFQWTVDAVYAYENGPLSNNYFCKQSNRTMDLKKKPVFVLFMYPSSFS